ncbi:hypothetical protein [Streptomyces sp. NPDC057694]|uniref:hypothetical protein n=1 Tax=Streptomyces sp. NPDC057694 TaxID=3346216 RepID=UPI0036C30E28
MTAYVEGSGPAVEAVATHGVGHVVGAAALGRWPGAASWAGHVTASLAVDDPFAPVTHYRSLADLTYVDDTLRDIRSMAESGEP